jgi:hypothetical protein
MVLPSPEVEKRRPAAGTSAIESLDNIRLLQPNVRPCKCNWSDLD